MTGRVICYLSEQRLTTEAGLTIIPVKYAHVVDFCVKVYSVSSTIKLIRHCLKYTPGASASFSHQSGYVWFQKDANTRGRTKTLFCKSQVSQVFALKFQVKTGKSQVLNVEFQVLNKS